MIKTQSNYETLIGCVNNNQKQARFWFHNFRYWIVDSAVFPLSIVKQKWVKNTSEEILVKKVSSTEQKMKFSMKDFFSKCDQIRRFRIWSHLLMKSLMENVIFYAVQKNFTGIIIS